MIRLDEKGLVPAIAQNANTGEVLTLGYVSAESLNRTFDSGQVWFYSRSRSELWHKGEVSGNYMHVRSISVDCDNDTLLLKVDPDGPACHTGNTTCFFTHIDDIPNFQRSGKGEGVLEELFAIIQDRKTTDPDDSYTALLMKAGVDRISQKVIEEAGEAAIEGVKGDKTRFAEETADLIYHILVLLAAMGGKPEDVWEQLRLRRK